MYCVHCGTNLPDEALFCWKCGKPQKGGVQQEEPKYDTCQIVMNNLGEAFGRTVFHFKFQGDAIGPNGKYVACETPKYTSDINYEVPRRKFERVVDELVRNLISDGWEPIESRGENWWNFQFRRQARPLESVDSDLPKPDARIMSLFRRFYPSKANRSWLNLPRIKEVSTLLLPTESLEGILFGKHPDTGVGGGGHLWATNTRLVYIGWNTWMRPVNVEYPYQAIHSIEFNAGKITLHTSQQTIIFKDIDATARASQFVELVQGKLDRPQ
jgi:hypothetical protein